MNKYRIKIKPHVDEEVLIANQAAGKGNYAKAFAHLERAHVLGQVSTFEHVRIHWLMFLWGARQKNLREMLGQIMRIVGAATKTAVGFVPSGNTGGSNVSPFKKLPIPPDLAMKIQAARAD